MGLSLIVIRSSNFRLVKECYEVKTNVLFFIKAKDQKYYTWYTYVSLFGNLKKKSINEMVEFIYMNRKIQLIFSVTEN